MSTGLKQAVNRVTAYVFPVTNSELETLRLKQKFGFAYTSNLPPQMMLYFNAFYAPFWFIGTMICFIIEFEFLSQIRKVVGIAVFLTYIFTEITRLYLGFIGNLAEKVPELAGFWLLSLLIQLPGIFYLLLDTGLILSSFERTIHAVEATFVILETTTGFFVVKLMVQNQAVKFYTLTQGAVPEDLTNTSKAHCA
ncbi:unnamed protein product [Dibothriocephalus latus]|uniref:Transmembrane protein 17B n=1 Tax=Dibothriocephalus latus TaxID=60516 RepID=A0A3P6PDS9_DIBLA|nr:unnamed protein product [Dibothriocephalus latus]